jgi:uncharacterized protein
MHPRAAELIETLRLERHPEGGWFTESHRSSERVTPVDGRGERAALTTIFFLLAAGEASRWHRVRSDEVWHLYEGGPLELLEMDEQGATLTRHRLDTVGAADGALPVRTIPAHHWQAARPLGDYVLLGCTVGPGFEFADFDMLADEPKLAARVRARSAETAALI